VKNAMISRSTSPGGAGPTYRSQFRVPTTGALSVIDVPLCPVRPTLCASPAYLRRRGSPAHPRELAAHDCLVFQPAGESWVFQSGRGLVQVDVIGRLIAHDNLTLLQAAIQLGVQLGTSSNEDARET
jgi:DNA-binding transcriptional LysR family regulator